MRIKVINPNTTASMTDKIGEEVATGSALGIAEADMHAASFIATGFSVITTLGRTKAIALACRMKRARYSNRPLIKIKGGMAMNPA